MDICMPSSCSSPGDSCDEPLLVYFNAAKKTSQSTVWKCEETWSDNIKKESPLTRQQICSPYINCFIKIIFYVRPSYEPGLHVEQSIKLGSLQLNKPCLCLVPSMHPQHEIIVFQRGTPETKTAASLIPSGQEHTHHAVLPPCPIFKTVTWPT